MVRATPHRVGKIVQIQTADAGSGYNAGLLAMGLHRLHQAGFTGKGIKVGIIDSGIDDKHQAFQDRVTKRRDYVLDGRTPLQFDSHGTHVAGIVGANGFIKGAALDCELLDYRVLDINGEGTWQNVARAIMDADADGCDVINLSLAGPENVPAVQEAIRTFEKRGPVIVAAGNEGVNTIRYPAYYPEVISVGAGALTSDGKWIRAFFSTTNPGVDVMAPGSNILSAMPGGNYIYMSGTSQGAPHVTGFAACLLQRGKERLGRPMTEPAIWEAIKCSTVDVDALGIDAASGAGFVTILPAWREPIKVEVTENSNVAFVDGTMMELVSGYSVAIAETRNGFFSLPMAFVAKILAGSKAWNETTRTGTFWIPRD